MAACDARGLVGTVKTEIESPGAVCRAPCDSLSGPLALWGNYQKVNSFIQSWRSSVHERGVPWARCLNFLPSKFVVFSSSHLQQSSPRSTTPL